MGSINGGLRTIHLGVAYRTHEMSSSVERRFYTMTGGIMRLSQGIPQYDRQQEANGRSAYTRSAYPRDLRALSPCRGRRQTSRLSLPTTCPNL